MALVVSQGRGVEGGAGDHLKLFQEVLLGLRLAQLRRRLRPVEVQLHHLGPGTAVDLEHHPSALRVAGIEDRETHRGLEVPGLEVEVLEPVEAAQ